MTDSIVVVPAMFFAIGITVSIVASVWLITRAIDRAGERAHQKGLDEVLDHASEAVATVRGAERRISSLEAKLGDLEAHVRKVGLGRAL